MSFFQIQQRTSQGLSDVGQFPEQIVGESGSAIIESGENANGSYIKFADGTLICSTPRLSLGTASLNKNLRTAFNFAASFINTEISYAFFSPGSPTGYLGDIGGAYANGPVVGNDSLTGATFALYTYRYPQNSITYWKVNSIGKWK